MTKAEQDFSEDLLRGADAVAQFLYGDGKMRRKVYHLAATTNFPHFKLGAMICARRSVVLRWIEHQEGLHITVTAKAVESENV
jgi:hypothetical protein